MQYAWFVVSSGSSSKRFHAVYELSIRKESRKSMVHHGVKPLNGGVSLGGSDKFRDKKAKIYNTFTHPNKTRDK